MELLFLEAVSTTMNTEASRCDGSERSQRAGRLAPAVDGALQQNTNFRRTNNVREDLKEVRRTKNTVVLEEGGGSRLLDELRRTEDRSRRSGDGTASTAGEEGFLRDGQRKKKLRVSYLSDTILVERESKREKRVFDID